MSTIDFKVVSILNHRTNLLKAAVKVNHIMPV